MTMRSILFFIFLFTSYTAHSAAAATMPDEVATPDQAQAVMQARQSIEQAIQLQGYLIDFHEELLALCEQGKERLAAELAGGGVGTAESLSKSILSAKEIQRNLRGKLTNLDLLVNPPEGTTEELLEEYQAKAALFFSVICLDSFRHSLALDIKELEASRGKKWLVPASTDSIVNLHCIFDNIFNLKFSKRTVAALYTTKALFYILKANYCYLPEEYKGKEFGKATTVKEWHDTIRHKGSPDECQRVLVMRQALLKESFDSILRDNPELECFLEDRDNEVPPPGDKLLLASATLPTSAGRLVARKVALSTQDLLMNTHKTAEAFFADEPQSPETYEAWQVALAGTAFELCGSRAEGASGGARAGRFSRGKGKGRGRGKKKGKGRKGAAPRHVFVLPKLLLDAGFLPERPEAELVERAEAFLMGDIPHLHKTPEEREAEEEAEREAAWAEDMREAMRINQEFWEACREREAARAAAAAEADDEEAGGGAAAPRDERASAGAGASAAASAPRRRGPAASASASASDPRRSAAAAAGDDDEEADGAETPDSGEKPLLSEAPGPIQDLAFFALGTRTAFVKRRILVGALKSLATHTGGKFDLGRAGTRSAFTHPDLREGEKIHPHLPHGGGEHACIRGSDNIYARLLRRFYKIDVTFVHGA